MKKLIAFVALTALLFTGAYAAAPKKDKTDNSQSKEDAKKKKEEEKKLKEELKAYEKNLAGYKAFKEQNQATLDSDQAQISRLTAQANAANARASDLETKVNNDEAQINALQQQTTADAAKKTDEASILPPASGTYYKVQLGLYKSFNINKYFSEPRTIGYEVVDGMNRYIIAYFNDEGVAQDFVKDIRKMGIKDAFVAKYIDGTRVYDWSANPKYKGKKVPNTLEDALKMNQQGRAKGK